MFKDTNELKSFLQGKVEILADDVKVTDEAALRGAMDELVKEAQFNESDVVKNAVRWVIREAGQSLGVTLASIHDLYMAAGRQEYSNISVPAINIRGFSYDMSRAIFETCLKTDNLAVIFEIAKSEQGYTFQPPAELVPVIMAAAIKEGFRGPLFIQGDHYQVAAKDFNADKMGAVDKIRQLIKDSIEAGFYNIDLDTSTLVDLSRPTVDEQQRDNYQVAAALTEFIRAHEPAGVTVSTGGEIGEIGDENTTVEELDAYMAGYKKSLPQGMVGLSKLSVQTGTTHGGVPLPDGSVADVKIDFETLKTLSTVAIEKYGLSGCVQHGASTLPDDAFNHFPRTKTSEVHLATGFQNILLESPDFPAEIKSKMYKWLDDNCASEKKEGQTPEQFYYKTRKKAWGPTKPDVYAMPEETKAKLRKQLADKFEFLFKQLNSVNTSALVNEKVKPVRIKAPKPAGI
jgi:fructose/tagatose bisphosphate aldolase